MCDEDIIHIINLRKSFGKVDVLRGVNLEVGKGTIHALLGSNGAGKTTTIKILSTLVKPNGGTALLAGYDILREPRLVRDNISLTGQYAAIDELLTGRENLKMIGELLHLKNRKNRIKELLDKFDLTEAADRRVSTYSGGMKRKIDIAMSLMGSPPVLFLDEPTTGLDPQSRKAMWGMIRGLSRSGVTIFLTTQYLEEAEQLAHRISILNEGKIIARGTSGELKKTFPGEILDFTVDSREEAIRVETALKPYGARLIPDRPVVRLETDGSVRELRRLFDTLSETRLQDISFEKKKASLEDVFLKIIGEKGEAFYE